MLISLGVAACTTSPERKPGPSVNDPVLEQLAATLPGDYATSAVDANNMLLLTVTTAPLIRQDPLVFYLTQQQSGQPNRRFALALRRAELPGAYEGFFAPLDASDRPVRRCDIDVTLRSSGLSAVTDPQTCQFGQGDAALGLIKEFAFDGNQLVIADRLVAASTATAGAATIIQDQIHSFHRIVRFTGWAGIKEGESWRLTRSIELDSANGQSEPLDAAGMALGFVVTLSRQRLDQMDTPILRLSVFDPDSGKTIAQSWADPDARAIGIALPDLQIGLTRVE